MNDDLRKRPAEASLLHVRSDFGRKRGEGRESTHQTGEHKQFPVAGQGRVPDEEGDGSTDDIAGTQIRDERADGEIRMNAVE